MKDDGLRQRFLQENSGKEITLNEVVNATCNKTGHLAVCQPVPIQLQILVKDELGKMINVGVIEEAIGPTEWCSPMVVAMKANGKVSICSDMTRLNKAMRREIHPMATVETSLAIISGKIFSKLDANSGLWQIPLLEESWIVTTF